MYFTNVHEYISHAVTYHAHESDIGHAYIEQYNPAVNSCSKCFKEIGHHVNHMQCRGVPPNCCEWCKVTLDNMALRLKHEVKCDLRPKENIKK